MSATHPPPPPSTPDEDPVRAVLATTEDRPAVADLLRRYTAEIAPFSDSVATDRELEDAWFELPEDLFPYRIVRGERTIGILLVLGRAYAAAVGSDAERVVYDLYVVEDERRTGAARTAVHQVLRAHPGSWSLVVLARNAKANAFWDRTLAPFDVTHGTDPEGLPTRSFVVD